MGSQAESRVRPFANLNGDGERRGVEQAMKSWGRKSTLPASLPSAHSTSPDLRSPVPESPYLVSRPDPPLSSRSKRSRSSTGTRERAGRRYHRQQQLNGYDRTLYNLVMSAQNDPAKLRGIFVKEDIMKHTTKAALTEFYDFYNLQACNVAHLRSKLVKLSDTIYESSTASDEQMDILHETLKKYCEAPFSTIHFTSIYSIHYIFIVPRCVRQRKRLPILKLD